MCLNHQMQHKLVCKEILYWRLLLLLLRKANGRQQYEWEMTHLWISVCVLNFLHAIYFCSADSLTTVSLLWGARTRPRGFPLELALTLPSKLREGWERTREQSHRCSRGSSLGILEMSPNAAIEPENPERVNIAGVNGPVFMGPESKIRPWGIWPSEAIPAMQISVGKPPVYLALTGLVPQHPSPVHLPLPPSLLAKQSEPEIEAGIKGGGRPKPDSPCTRCAYPGEYCTGHCTVINVWPCKVLSRVTVLQFHTHTRTLTLIFNRPGSQR